jgi:hypothetical protein
MKNRNLILSILTMLAILLSACQPSATPVATEAPAATQALAARCAPAATEAPAVRGPGGNGGAWQ